MAFPTTPTNGQISVVGNVTYSYSTSDNTWTRVAGNVVVATNLSVTQWANISSTTSSTSTTTGAVIVAGGVGVAENVNVGGTITTANLKSSGFFWANGAPFSSGSAGVTSAKVYGLNIAFGTGI